MSELKDLLRRFLAREIGLTELQRRFALLLEGDTTVAAPAAAWLDSAERDGLLSTAVCTALKNVIVSHLATSAVGIDFRESGVFDAPEELHRKSGDTEPKPQSSPPDPAPRPMADETPETLFDPQSGGPDADRTRLRPPVEASGDAGSQLQTGSVISARYELLEEIGSGGMGSVFKAHDRLRARAQDRNPYIALKLLSESFRQHPDSMIALQREAQRAQTLAHPNVVTVHEFYEDGPNFYLTMELLQGRTLDELLESKHQNRLSMDDAWPIIESVGQALQYGHEKGVVHSDIKPGNIFICDDGTVKVLDFGISRPIPVSAAKESEQTKFDPGERLGSLTPAYASLEMWYHDTPDPRDDIYALACVSYLILTGRHPFDGHSAKTAYEKKWRPKRIASISKGQWSALAAGLALRRRNRTASVKEFLDELTPQTIVRSRRRLVSLTAATIVAILASLGVWYYGQSVEDRVIDEGIAQPVFSDDAAFERPVLTAQQVEELDNLVALANFELRSIDGQTSVDALQSILSSGPNSVLQILRSVLSVDAGYESALETRQRVFEIYTDRARDLIDRRDYESATRLIQNADDVVPGTGTVRRLRKTICDRAPEACERR